jgi:hypothetical protein
LGGEEGRICDGETRNRKEGRIRQGSKASASAEISEEDQLGSCTGRNAGGLEKTARRKSL